MATNTQNTPDARPAKKIKKKGPIRTEAVVPALIVFALIYGYFFFFFDSHLRRGSEYVLTQIHGAEVNIEDITTSFFGASISVKKVQITDKNQPARDLFRVGEMRFKTLWDGLLRAKIVIEDASIVNIQALVPRDKPGYVLPPPPPSEGSVLAEVQNEIVSQTRAKLQDNFLGDIVAIAGGVNYKDQLKTIEGELKAGLRIKELDAALKQKRTEWDQRLKTLPEADYAKGLEARFKQINWNEKDPVKFANNLKTANDLLKEAKSKVEEVDKAQRDLRGDLKTYGGSVGELQSFIDQDLKDLQARLKIPSIDPKDFTQQFFMGQIEERLVSVRKYYEVAKKYMPPKKTAEEKAEREAERLVPPKRGDGETVSFPITKGYPKFWLQKAFISSEVSSSEYSGNITGEILDVTSHPAYLGKPTRVNISGDFPKQQISGLDLKAIIDFTKATPKQTVDLKIAGFPMGQVKLSDSSDVKLALTPGAAAIQMHAELTENEAGKGQIIMDTKSQYNQVKYDIQAKEKMVQEILTSVFAAIPQVTLNAKVQGPWDALRFNMNSNLGEELAKGFGKQLQLKIEEAKVALRAEIDKRIGVEKENLQKQVTAFSGDLEKSLGLKKGQLDKGIKDIEKGIEKEGNGLVKKDDLKKIEEKGKKLLKGFGIGG